MQANTYPSFVGVQKLKEIHRTQITLFEQWASKDQWERFHSGHYDWWVFPLNRQSSYGMKWVVYEAEIAELKRDPSFLDAYCKGVELVAASWGWDVLRHAYLPQPKPGQSWHDWPIRLFKAAASSQLFGYEDLFASLRAFALELAEQGAPLSYRRKDLSWLFTTGIDPNSRL